MMRLAKHWLKDAVYEGLRLFDWGREDKVQAILLYHLIGNGFPADIGQGPYKRQCGYLSTHMQVFFLRDLHFLQTRSATDKALVSLTFDDGALDNYTTALPILEEFGLKATFFVIAGLVGKSFNRSTGPVRLMEAQHLRELVALGHEIGAHTVNHPRLTRIPVPEAAQEIRDSKAILEDLIGAPVVSFAYPYGDYNQAIEDSVQEAGFHCAVTTREALLCDATLNWFALPRIGVDATVGMMQFKAKLSPAVERYERLRGRRRE